MADRPWTWRDAYAVGAELAVRDSDLSVGEEFARARAQRRSVRLEQEANRRKWQRRQERLRRRNGGST